jgi:metal-responsive CopG/Arc/MetJ family transcriptional regulator
MPNVKTAISLQESLFKEAEALARELEISRSQLFAMALENFIKQHENRQLLKQINVAYSEAPNPDEQAYQTRMKDYHRQSVEGEW